MMTGRVREYGVLVAGIAVVEIPRAIILHRVLLGLAPGLVGAAAALSARGSTTCSSAASPGGCSDSW